MTAMNFHYEYLDQVQEIPVSMFVYPGPETAKVLVPYFLLFGIPFAFITQADDDLFGQFFQNQLIHLSVTC